MSEQEVTKRLPAGKEAANEAIRKCAVISTLKLFATKWKPCIICFLSVSPLRYNELYRAIPNISRKMLSEHLDELEKEEVIIRTVFDPKLQKVEYSLSDKGRSLLPLFETLEKWGLANLPGVNSIQDMIHYAGITEKK